MNEATWERVVEERQNLLATINLALYKKYGEDEAERRIEAVHNRINSILNELGTSENLDALVGIIALQKMADSQMVSVLEQVRQREAN
jgi:hypothetical protein